MIINFNVTGKDRKALAQVLAEITFSEMVYTGAPTFAYQVGDYTINKNGAISYPDTLEQEAVALIVEKLKAQGFTPEIEVNADIPEKDDPAEIPAETPDVLPETTSYNQLGTEVTEAAEGAETPEVGRESEVVPADTPEESEESADSGNDAKEDTSTVTQVDGTKFTVSVPRKTLTNEALERLKMIVANKEVLFKRAVVADDLPIEVTEEKISFPWFTLTGMDGEAAAYTQFIAALCQMASEQTRILNKPYDGDNDRFAMRIFMVRLGMKGAQYALVRKLMMKHLTGNSAWKNGAPPTPPRTAVYMRVGNASQISKPEPEEMSE